MNQSLQKSRSLSTRMNRVRNIKDLTNRGIMALLVIKTVFPRRFAERG